MRWGKGGVREVYKFVKRVIAAWVLFVAIAVIGGGGDPFRFIFEKAGFVSQRIVDFVANKADSLKGEADTVKEYVKKWTGRNNKTTENVFRTDF
jgi:hypothetical protein